MEDAPKLDVNFVIGKTIGEMRALHVRMDKLEKDMTGVLDKLSSRPSRAERYLLVVVAILLGLLVISSVVIYRAWLVGK